MPPTTARDFQKAAAQRFTTAEFLLTNKRTLDAEYLLGYTIECSLKALILEKTPVVDQPAQIAKICSGAKWHRPDVLVGVLRDLGVELPLKLSKRYRRIAWSTDLRYETGHRDTGEVRAFLRTARENLRMGRGAIDMTKAVAESWKSKRTDETRQVEKALIEAGFQRVDAYRYNTASIRVRVIDPRFSRKSVAARDKMVDRHLKKLPERTQADIMTLLTFAPDEIANHDVSKAFLLNAEFEEPSPSML